MALEGMRFEPMGATRNPEIPETSSILDYVARYLSTSSAARIDTPQTSGPSSRVPCTSLKSIAASEAPMTVARITSAPDTKSARPEPRGRTRLRD